MSRIRWPKARTPRVARLTAAQIGKFDRTANAEELRFVKLIPRDDLRMEMRCSVNFFAGPTVMEALRKFVESTDAHPYLP